MLTTSNVYFVFCDDVVDGKVIWKMPEEGLGEMEKGDWLSGNWVIEVMVSGKSLIIQ